jgi:hypothetical protein
MERITELYTRNQIDDEQAATFKVAGMGGLAFALILIIQNVIHAFAPAGGASAADVATHYADHRTLIILTLGLLPFGALSLFLFASGVLGHLQNGSPWTRFWGRLGAIGITLIGALFLLTNVFEIGLAVHASHLADDAALTAALFDLRNAAFGLNLAAIGISLWGLGLGARHAGLTPSWTFWLVLPGGGLLLTGSGVATLIADGSPLLGVAGIGFLCWFAWLIVTSVALVRKGGVSLPAVAVAPDRAMG